MPTSLPSKKIAKKKSDTGLLADCVGIWAISLGVVAAAFAMFVYFGDSDQVAATFILCAAAFLIQMAAIAVGQEHA